MPAPITKTGVDVVNSTLAASTADFVTLSAGGRVCTVINWDLVNRLYIQFDPANPASTTVPAAAATGAKVIPPGDFRVFQRPGQSKPITAFVFGSSNEYTIDSEPA